MQDFSLDFSLDVGRNSNHIIHSFIYNALFTVSETDHMFYQVLPAQHAMQMTSTGTHGNIYPKKIFNLFDIILLPTYNGDVRNFSLDEVFGEFYLEDIVLLPYKIEEANMASANMVPLAFLFTTPYHKDGSVSNEVLFWSMFGMSVREQNQIPKDLIYPNPTNGNFSIILKDSNYNLSNLRIDIFNQFGQFVFTEFYSGSNNVINIQLPVDRIASGTYYLTISDGKINRTQPLNVVK
jgi:hypothetical protein